MVSAGENAPDFELQDQDGEVVSLSQHRGKWVVLWWYPAASTGGCTIEGQGFRDRAPSLEEANAVVLGISFDPPEKNKVFREENGFSYRLLSDVDRSVAAAYGSRRPDDDTWNMLPKRMTYLIDPAGVVRKVYEVEDVTTHPEVVLGDILSGAAH